MSDKVEFRFGSDELEVEVLGSNVWLQIDPCDYERFAVNCCMSPEEARRLAAALTQMADRIEGTVAQPPQIPDEWWEHDEKDRCATPHRPTP